MDARNRCGGCCVVKESGPKDAPERPASLLVLTAGVAHELNNPLSFVMSNLRFASDELSELAETLAQLPEAEAAGVAGRLEELQNALADAAQGAERMRRVIRDLKQYARTEEAVGEMRDLELDSALDAALEAVRPQWEGRATVVRRYRSAPRVRANEDRLGEVFQQLLSNAALALPEGGPEEGAPDPLIEVCLGTAPDGAAELSVRDTGCGIASEHLGRIFDPFFTTRPIGSGSGLGLAVCLGVVTQLGGSISVESAPGDGSTFTVWLPPAPASPLATGTPDRSAPESR